MMATITCEYCNMIMGEIEKTSFSEQDLLDYEIMFKCDCGTEIPVKVTIE